MTQSLVVLALQMPGAPPDASPVLQYVWYIVALLLTICAGLIWLLVKKGERGEQATKERVSATEGLLNTRNTELADKEKALKKAQEDLSEVEAELRTLSGINVKLLMDFWAKKEAIEARVALAESENRRLQYVIEGWERGERPTK